MKTQVVLFFRYFTAIASVLLLGVGAIASPTSNGGKPVQAFLPTGTSYNLNIPTPEAVIGSQLGEWHVRHDQLVKYMEVLARSSERVSLIETGRTHENRPLLLLAITSDENQGNLELLRKTHVEAINRGTAVREDSPLVLYMGYSIHGNEPSGSNASMAVAYYLAAAQGQQVDNLLNENIVLIDPSLNPDGLSRFAQWANMHKGQSLVADPNHREHKEGWPNGRTNHYWFDLNRDWLLLTHPESRARIKQFHRWRPHVLTDFHEMGTNSTYFFQPGVRSRKNPLTPDANVTLTEALAEFHASAFDAQKKLYFSQEDFDDFYYGKGSTYPDAHGSIGILFEQASSRGHLQSSINGPLAFADTIQNQVTTSLSTFAGALANKPALLEYQSQFFNDTKAASKADKSHGYILSIENDPLRLNKLKSILSQHHIEFQYLERDYELEEQVFAASSSLFVPLDQPQYRLVKSLFSTQQSFPENTFYDVSNWNIALAFNAQYAAVPDNKKRQLKTAASAVSVVSNEVDVLAGAYAYLFEWEQYGAPALTQALLSQGVHLRASSQAFTAKTPSGTKEFSAGTVVVPMGLNQPDNVEQLINVAATQQHVSVHAITSGFTPMGSDLGSRKIEPIYQPKVLLIGGLGVNPYEAGEVWHYLDTRVGLPLTIVDQARIDSVNLGDYSHIVLVSGRYSSLRDPQQLALEKWVEQGGVLIGLKGGLDWLVQQKWLDLKRVSRDSVDAAFDTRSLQFGDRDALYAKKLIAGAAFETRADLTHPLFFGMNNDILPVFKSANRIYKGNKTPFSEIANYTNDPLLAGYAAQEMVDLIAESVAIKVEPLGRGVVIGFVDNILFRGYWYGTDKLLSNALYLSPLMH